MKIKTIELLPPETRVLLKEKMRRRIFSDERSIAKSLALSIDTVKSWRKGKTKPTLGQLKKLSISNAEIANNIITVGTKKRQIKLPTELGLSKLSWLLGIIEGDRAGNSNESIGISNNNKGLIKKFIAELENLNIDRDLMILNVNVCENKFPQINKFELSAEFGIPVQKIFITSVKMPIKKPVFQVLVMNRVIASLFKNALNILKQKMKANSECSRKFVQGFSDADGSVSVKDRTIEIRQKNSERGRERVLIVSKILRKCGIVNSIEGPNCENMLIIRVLGGKRNLKNLEKFGSLISFSDQEKLDKLNQILNEPSLAHSLVV